MWGWVILGGVAGALALLVLWSLLAAVKQGLGVRGQGPGVRGQGNSREA